MNKRRETCCVGEHLIAVITQSLGKVNVIVSPHVLVSAIDTQLLCFH